MFIQLHVICIFMLFMKHQDVHNDWFMWIKVSYVWINLGYCRDICLRISRAVAVTKICKCRHPRALASKYRLLWKKPPWWYFHIFQWRSHCSRLASLKGCSSKVVGGWAVTQLKFNTAFDPGSNTKTYFAVLTMHDESTVLAYHSKIQMVLL